MTENPLSTVPGEENNTVERIRTNALEHFSKYGYVGASVREITQAAHVTKPTLYYYFHNKEELYRGLATSCFNKMMSTLENSLVGLTAFSERFCSLVEAYYSFCAKDFPSAHFIRVVSVAPPRDVPDVGIDKFNQRLASLISKIVFEACEKGEIQENRKAGTELILRGMFSMAVEKRLKDKCIPIDAIREAISYLVVTRK